MVGNYRETDVKIDIRETDLGEGLMKLDVSETEDGEGVDRLWILIFEGWGFMDDEDIDKGLKLIIGGGKVIRELDNFRLLYFMKGNDGDKVEII